MIDATPRALNAHGVNVKAHHRDRRFTGNQNGKRKVVVTFRGETAIPSPQFSNMESQAASLFRARIAKGTVVHADEAAAWDNLHERFEIKRINRQETHSLDGACTNMAEEYVSRLRRAEIAIHHHIASAYLLRYAQESSRLEDNRRTALALRRASGFSKFELRPALIERR